MLRVNSARGLPAIVRMKIKNTVGGFQFEPKKDGTPRKQTTLKVSKSALTGAQSASEDDQLISYWEWVRRWSERYPQLTGMLPGHTRGRLAFHVENERELDRSKMLRRRNPRTGAYYWFSPAGQKRKLKGVVRGVVDVLHLIPSDGYAYLAIDLKVLDGDPSPEQLEFVQQARAVGASGHFAWCWPELARLTMRYYRIEDRLVLESAGDPRDFIVPQYGRSHNQSCGCGMTI